MNTRKVLLLIGVLCFSVFIIGAVLMAWIDFRSGSSTANILEGNPSMQELLASNGSQAPSSIELRIFAGFWIVFMVLGISGIISIFKKTSETIVALSVIVVFLALLMLFFHPGSSPSNSLSLSEPKTLSNLIAIIGGLGAVCNLIMHTKFKSMPNSI